MKMLMDTLSEMLKDESFEDFDFEQMDLVFEFLRIISKMIRNGFIIKKFEEFESPNNKQDIHNSSFVIKRIMQILSKVLSYKEVPTHFNFDMCRKLEREENYTLHMTEDGIGSNEYQNQIKQELENSNYSS
jgi:hypothetical protein